MNFFFYFNWEFSELCHALAVSLKEDFGDANKFSGMAVVKQDYSRLSHQDEVQYSNLYYVHDPMNRFNEVKIDPTLVSRYEQEYGNPSLWSAVYADRELTTYNRRTYTHFQYLQILQTYTQHIEKMLDESNPDYIIMDCVASLPSYLLFSIAQKRGIKTLIFTIPMVGDRIEISYEPFVGFNKILEEFQKIRTGSKPMLHETQAIQFLESFRKKTVQPKHIDTEKASVARNLSLSSLVGKFPKAFQYIQRDLEGHPDSHSFDPITFESKVSEMLEKNFRRHHTFRSDFFEEPILGEKYVFFPLHLEPELATMVRAPMHVHQLPLIRNIAQSLPVEYKLYVKEHPMQHYYGKPRDMSYYHELKKIPNLRLIRPALDSYSLINNSNLVFVITGTAGWETVLLKKPLITFGGVFYNALSMVDRCENMDLLPKMIFNKLQSNRHDESELVQMVSAIYSNSFEGDFISLMGVSGATSSEICERPDFSNLYNFFCKEVGLNPLSSSQLHI